MIELTEEERQRNLDAAKHNLKGVQGSIAILEPVIVRVEKAKRRQTGMRLNAGEARQAYFAFMEQYRKCLDSVVFWQKRIEELEK